MLLFCARTFSNSYEVRAALDTTRTRNPVSSVRFRGADYRRRCRGYLEGKLILFGVDHHLVPGVKRPFQEHPGKIVIHPALDGPS